MRFSGAAAQRLNASTPLEDGAWELHCALLQPSGPALAQPVLVHLTRQTDSCREPREQTQLLSSCPSNLTAPGAATEDLQVTAGAWTEVAMTVRGGDRVVLSAAEPPAVEGDCVPCPATPLDVLPSQTVELPASATTAFTPCSATGTACQRGSVALRTLLGLQHGEAVYSPVTCLTSGCEYRPPAGGRLELRLVDQGSGAPPVTVRVTRYASASPPERPMPSCNVSLGNASVSLSASTPAAFQCFVQSAGSWYGCQQLLLVPLVD